MATYTPILTNGGAQALADSIANNTPLVLKYFAWGDGNGSPIIPSQSQTALVNEVYRQDVTSVTINPDNPYWLDVLTIVPATVGNFTVREVGIFTDTGVLFAVASHPEFYKNLPLDGTAIDFREKLILEITSLAEVNIILTPSLVLVTQDEFDAFSKTVQPKLDTHIPGEVYISTSTNTVGYVPPNTSSVKKYLSQMNSVATWDTIDLSQVDYKPYSIASGAVDSNGKANFLSTLDDTSVTIHASSTPLVVVHADGTRESVTTDQTIPLFATASEPPTFVSNTTTSFTVSGGTEYINSTTYTIAPMTKSLSLWSVGSGGGSLLDASITANTVYYVFDLIPNEGTVGDIAISKLVNPTPPSGYTLVENKNIYLTTNASSQLNLMTYAAGIFTYVNSSGVATALNALYLQGSTGPLTSYVPVPPNCMATVGFYVQAWDDLYQDNTVVTGYCQSPSDSVTYYLSANEKMYGPNYGTYNLRTDALSRLTIGISNQNSSQGAYSTSLTIIGFSVLGANNNATLTLLKIKNIDNILITSANLVVGTAFPSLTAGLYYLNTSVLPYTTWHCNGTSWVKTDFVPIGEVNIVGGAVGAPISYSFNNNFQSVDLPCVGVSTPTVFNHNMGTNNITATLYLRCVTSEAGYEVGEVIEPYSYSSIAQSVPLNLALRKNTVSTTTSSSSAYFITDKLTGNSVTPTPANWVQFVKVERDF